MIPRRATRAAKHAPSVGAGLMRHQRKPGWPLHRVPMRVEGRPLDHVEAATMFADRTWADQAEYIGSSRGFHVFQRPPG